MKKNSNLPVAAKKQGKEPKVEWTRGEMTEMVLKAVGVSLLIGGVIVFPTLPIVVGAVIDVIEDFKGAQVDKRDLPKGRFCI